MDLIKGKPDFISSAQQRLRPQSALLHKPISTLVIVSPLENIIAKLAIVLLANKCNHVPNPEGRFSHIEAHVR